jgi:hypothetical protein
MDFECDVGYKRASSGLCEATKDMKPIETPETCNSYYEVT